MTLSDVLSRGWPAAPVADDGTPVPLVPGDRVEPGQVYDASDGGAPFALPLYSLEVVDGRFTSSLRWRGPEDDPSGPVAFFTLRLRVQPPDGRADLREIPHQYTATLTSRVPVSDTDGAGAPLSMVLGAVERLDATTAQVRLGLVGKAEFDALWGAITDADRPAEISLTAQVDVGRHVPRRWPRIPDLLLENLVKPVVIPEVEHEIPPRIPDLDPGFRWRERAFPIERLAVEENRMLRLHRLVPLRRKPFDIPLDVIVDGPLVADPVPDPDPVADPPPAPVVRLALPAGALVAPVCFPVETNAYMFDVPGDLRPQTTRLLLRHEFDPGGDRDVLVYYEDTAFPGRFYYEPQAFRVPRDEVAPYLPKIRVAFTGVVPEEDPDGTATVQYRARLRYSVVPDLDPVVLGALRRELAEQHGTSSPDLTALLPEKASLELALPDDATGGALAPVSHTLDGQAFDDGLADEVELSPTEFATVVALLQSDAVRGNVVADLVGAGQTSVPLSVSLRETPSVRLHRTYRGPVGVGLVRVTVANPLESPVEIVDLYRSDAGAGVSAFPQSTAPISVPAGGSADLDYRLVPDGADVEDLHPAVNAVVEADLAALLPQLLVNSGYSDQEFPLSVRTDAASFGATPAGAPGPLVGLLVQFECDVEVLLDAAAAAKDTSLRMPMLPWLLKDADAQDYRYRVINVHQVGEAVQQGTAGPWTDGSGGGVLTVAPVGG